MEYIERDALLKKQQMDADIFKGSTLRTDMARRDEALNAVANIVNAPAADVAPVVYCKDCYWWNGEKCDRGIAGNGGYFYCALGQRKPKR